MWLRGKRSQVRVESIADSSLFSGSAATQHLIVPHREVVHSLEKRWWSWTGAVARHASI